MTDPSVIKWPEAKRPPWVGGSSEPTFAGIMPVQQAVGRSAQAVIVLVEIRVYPQSCQLELDIAVRAVLDRTAPGNLHIGVEFADGRSASMGDHVLAPRTQPEAPSLISTEGAGFHVGTGTLRLRDKLWLWPLPPAEPFQLVAEWPDLGIPRSQVTIDGSAIRAAAEAAVAYW
jgi:hypothetical protein